MVLQLFEIYREPAKDPAVKILLHIIVRYNEQMPKTQTWKQLFDNEIDQALAARSIGNEGKARVCARRAVGIVIGEYMKQQQLPDPGPSAYDRLKYLTNSPEIDQELQNIAAHFILRIDYDHNLPISADLVAEALWIANRLFGYAKS